VDRRRAESQALVKAVLEGGKARDFIVRSRGPSPTEEDYFSVSVYPAVKNWNEVDATTNLRSINFRVPIAKWEPGAIVRFGNVRRILVLDDDAFHWIMHCISVCVNEEGYGEESHNARPPYPAVPAFKWRYSTGAKGFQERRKEVLDWFAQR
jgi:hypothetical protein